MSEWDKLQEHFEQRTLDLRTEVERLNRTLTEAEITRQSKEAEFEQLLIVANQNASEQEVSNNYMTLSVSVCFKFVLSQLFIVSAKCSAENQRRHFVEVI